MLVFRRADTQDEIGVFPAEPCFAPTRPVEQSFLVELIQLGVDSVAPKLLREHENTVTMLSSVVAIADEHTRGTRFVFCSTNAHGNLPRQYQRENNYLKQQRTVKADDGL